MKGRLKETWQRTIQRNNQMGIRFRWEEDNKAAQDGPKLRGLIQGHDHCHGEGNESKHIKTSRLDSIYSFQAFWLCISLENALKMGGVCGIFLGTCNNLHQAKYIF